MKLTSICLYRHPKYYFYASFAKWGLKKQKEFFHKKWRYDLVLNRNLPLEEYVVEKKFKLPAGYLIHKPESLRAEIKPEYKLFYDKEKPWPFNTLINEKSYESENYKEERALLYDRKFQLLEGYKGALNFTNTVLESDDSLPDIYSESDIELDEKVLKSLNHRLNWSEYDDGFNHGKSARRIFPRLNKKVAPKYGPTLERKEFNILNSYFDCSELLFTKQNSFTHLPKVISPNYVIAFLRENKKCILDLRCDFITLLQNPEDESFTKRISEKNLIFSQDFEKTKDEELININPVNWEINFEKSHIYPDDEILNKPLELLNHNVDTVFISNNFNIHKFIPDRQMKGKVLMFLYGYAVGRARKLYGNQVNYLDEKNYKVLEKPIIIKSVFANYTKKNIGFACFQLNTTDFNSEIKNQIWFDDTYDMFENQEIILKKMALMNKNYLEI